MNTHLIVEAGLLAIVVVACWLGVLGMWRMREPTQALHYLSLPAAAGGLALVIAVFVEEGNNPTSYKSALIVVVILAINSVVTHATARAFRAREIGHWEPRDGDPFEWARSDSGKEQK